MIGLSYQSAIGTSNRLNVRNDVDYKKFRTKAVRKMENLRLFLGIALSNEAEKRLASLSERLARDLVFRSWTHPSDYHMTLHFLGDTPSSRVDSVAEAARAAAANAAPLALELGEPGTFGSPAAPRILWCGVREPGAAASGAGLSALAALQAELGRRLAASSGFVPEERPFRAHITLARGGGPGSGDSASLRAAWSRAVQALGSRGDGTAQPLAPDSGDGHNVQPPATASGEDSGRALVDGPAGSWISSGITLYRSHLGRRPSYERIAEFPFGL